MILKNYIIKISNPEKCQPKKYLTLKKFLNLVNFLPLKKLIVKQESFLKYWLNNVVEQFDLKILVKQKMLFRLYLAVVYLKVFTWLSCSGLCGRCCFRQICSRFICWMIFCCSMKIRRRIRPCVIFCRISSRGLTPSRIVFGSLN